MPRMRVMPGHIPDVVSLTAGADPWALTTMTACGRKADTAFSGYQLLLEYFSFRPKFMFVELRGLDTIGLAAASTGLKSTLCSVKPGHPVCLLRQKLPPALCAGYQSLYPGSRPADP